ncbi:T9SS type A sorting domain-containing protein [Allomuricauda sp. SCSIO 65647]|uniref:T9SS type A sorting domain-containing protein n=1 Tax=Allomuricauda sp. SCSIO 65647 TaxID=2908843 RepID=UPI001F24E143|nr:T9SS type A sorting domain-containing protein [Muricauda sp. SCSIO 65647]UJH67810.1 T9SS type A sorting domain-containing protein [Muricauda sp. SCSIO 65647]
MKKQLLYISVVASLFFLNTGKGQSYKFYENEGFENGLGQWKNVDYDNIDWISQSGPTPSRGTGPNGASKGNKYLYLEASHGNHNKAGSIVRELDFTNAENPVLALDHMIHGQDSGRLWLIVVYGDNDHRHIPIATGEGGNSKQEWQRARIPLKDFVGGKVQLTIRGITGSGYRGDVAIDAVTVYEKIVEKTYYAFHENESFEKGFGQWENVDYDNIDWTRQSGPTPSRGTGPNGASKGNKYLYLEASHGNHNKAGSIVRELDFTNAENPVLALDHMIHGQDGGRLWLIVVYGDNDHVHIPIATGERENSKQEWQRARIPLKDFVGGKVQLTIRGITGSGYRGDVAIDAVAVYEKIVEYEGYEKETTATAQKTAIDETETMAMDFGNEDNDGTTLKLYPNPARTNVNVSFFVQRSREQHGILNMYDLMGNKVLETKIPIRQGKNQHLLDIGSYTSGIYIVTLLTEETVMKSKLIIK